MAVKSPPAIALLPRVASRVAEIVTLPGALTAPPKRTSPRLPLPLAVSATCLPLTWPPRSILPLVTLADWAALRLPGPVTVWLALRVALPPAATSPVSAIDWPAVTLVSPVLVSAPLTVTLLPACSLASAPLPTWPPTVRFCPAVSVSTPLLPIWPAVLRLPPALTVAVPAALT